MSQANSISDLERSEHQDGAKKVLVFGYDDSTDSHIQLATNSDGELKVNLETADIEIGAVELKDGGSDQRATVNSDGSLPIAGNVAAAGTDSGNPIKIGGKYNSTMPTYTDGQRGDIQISTRGAVKTVLYNNDSAVALVAKADNADAVAVTASPVGLQVQNRNTVFNGTTWDRLTGDMAKKITTSGTTTYIAKAALGSAQASAVWKVKKIDSTGTTTWCDGNNNFDNVATDLTSLSYS